MDSTSMMKAIQNAAMMPWYLHEKAMPVHSDATAIQMNRRGWRRWAASITIMSEIKRSVPISPVAKCETATVSGQIATTAAAKRDAPHPTRRRRQVQQTSSTDSRP